MTRCFDPQWPKLGGNFKNDSLSCAFCPTPHKTISQPLSWEKKLGKSETPPDGMVPLFLPFFSYESFPKQTKMKHLNRVFSQLVLDNNKLFSITVTKNKTSFAGSILVAW